MMTIWETLARCSSPGEIQRMVRGTGWELIKTDEIERLRQTVIDGEKRCIELLQAGMTRTPLAILPSDKPRVVIIHSLAYAEYQVPGPDNTEAQIYYTNDREDAIDTAKAIFGAEVAIEIQDYEEEGTVAQRPLEYCCNCEEPTGRAGRGEDSLYLRDDGPYCDECWNDPSYWRLYAEAIAEQVQ